MLISVTACRSGLCCVRNTYSYNIYLPRSPHSASRDKRALWRIVAMRVDRTSDSEFAFGIIFEVWTYCLL